MKFVLIIPTNRPNDWSNILSNIKKQSLQPDVVIAVENGNHLSWTKEATITIQSEENVGLARQKGLEVARDKYPNSFFAMIDGDDYYGSSYLEEIFINKDKADIIGKHKVFYKFENTNVLAISNGIENDFCEVVHGPTMACHTANALDFQKCNGWGEDMCWQKRMFDDGFKLYATSRYNFCGIRTKDLSNHTWYVPDFVASQCMNMDQVVFDYKSFENIVENKEIASCVSFNNFSFDI